MYIFHGAAVTTKRKKKKKDLILQRRWIRPEANPFDLPESKFKMYFHLDKVTFKYVLSLIENSFPQQRSVAIPTILKLAGTLRFFAEGSYQKGVGNDFNLGLAQATLNKFFEEMLNILEEKCCRCYRVR